MLYAGASDQEMLSDETNDDINYGPLHTKSSPHKKKLLHKEEDLSSFRLNSKKSF
jgi:hypothetical protein